MLIREIHTIHYPKSNRYPRL